MMRVRHVVIALLCALVAVALPGLLCALADCVLYVVPQMFCIVAIWVSVVCIPFFRFPRA